MGRLATLLLALGAGAGAWVALPQTAGGVADVTAQAVCAAVPEDCLAWRRRTVEARAAALAGHRARLQQGLRLADEQEGALRARLDAVEANARLLAAREAERRAAGAATLDFAARRYAPAQVAEQQRLWQAEAEAFRHALETEVEDRRLRFRTARDALALAQGRLDGVLRGLQAELLLAPVTRDLARLREIGAALEEADRAGAAAGAIASAADPVRSVLDLQAPRGASLSPGPADMPHAPSGH